MLKTTNCQTRRCRNSHLHKCLRLPEWHDHAPEQVKRGRELYTIKSKELGTCRILRTCNGVADIQVFTDQMA